MRGFNQLGKKVWTLILGINILFIWHLECRPSLEILDSRFPEQSDLRPEVVNDGQTMSEKQEVMRLLAVLENKSESQLGIKKDSLSSFASSYVFEGDIILTPVQVQAILDQTSRRRKRKLVSDEYRRWTLPINYRFDGTHDKSEQQEIQNAMKIWSEETCIEFKETNLFNGTGIVYTNEKGCWSYVGRQSSDAQQIVSIGSGCYQTGTIEHEIGHVIGFWHEHARPDRDDHITIINDNIKNDSKSNFVYESWRSILTYDIPYDVGSLMHYGSETFSKNGLRTIETKDPLMQRVLGQRYELSFYDVKLANLAYCKDVCYNKTLSSNCLHDGYQDPKNCSRCRCADGLSGDFCQYVAPSTGQCGGHVTLQWGDKKVLTSPGYPGNYYAGTKCNWMIESPNGTRISIKFTGLFLNYSSCDSSFIYYPCRDYVEVKYQGNLGATGGRFCCNNTRPLEPIVTHQNRSLILFRSRGEGQYGFNITVSISSCGGCYDSTFVQQPFCTKIENYTCKQTWNEIQKEPCTNMWMTLNCDQYKVVTKERYAVCYREVQYCCEGFDLIGTSCLKKGINLTGGDNLSVTYNIQSDTTSNDLLSSDALSQMTSWTEWSNCSRSCGGCGTQTRTRTCVSQDNCRKDFATAEERICNNNICMGFKKFCSSQKQIPFYAMCGFFQTCLRYRTETVYFVCDDLCCAGYSVQNDICVPDS
ncbi:hypothetical protein ACJMK2_004390 [Sinanodonta woodiana]|uniref:Metalloendopeptidase n=1 Tax=Sinanodonta woodiana TaxID=1069815 RepID=A0ABD3Y2G2_SINWO